MQLTMSYGFILEEHLEVAEARYTPNTTTRSFYEQKLSSAESAAYPEG
jgi:hypothetical protein